MDSDKSLRLKRNIKIINDNKRKLWDAVEKRDNDEIYHTTVDLLNWVINTDDWFFKNDSGYKERKKENQEINDILLGLRQAYNSFKHNMKIISIEDKHYEELLKINENIIYMERIVWLPSTKIKSKKNSRKAFEAYKQYLRGKEVLVIFNKAIKFLNEEF